MGLPAAAAPADIAIEITNIGGLEITPTALVQPASGDVCRGVAALDPVLQLSLVVRERAAQKFDLGAVVREPVLHPHRQSPAQGIEAEYRIGADEVHPVDRKLWDQIPVDRIAERLIEPHPVQIDREPLRVTLQRGGKEPVVEKVGLERVAGGVVERDARDVFIERPQHLRVAVPADIAIGQYLGLSRHLVAIDPRPEQRRHSDNLDGG